MKTTGILLVIMSLGLVNTALGQPVLVEEPGIDLEEPPSSTPSAPAPAVVDRMPVWVRTAPVPRPVPSQPLSDPAESRLSIFSTAETLEAGQWSLVSRGMVTLEFAIGATDWLELGFKNIPTLFLVPDGAENTLYMGSARWRMLHTGWLTLTAEADFLAFLGWAGVRAGLQTRWGSDRAAFHLGSSGLRLWGVTPDGWEVDEACDGCEDPTLTSLIVNGGGHVRVSRRVKLMLDVSYFRQDEDGLLLAAPAVRLHGHHFAADLGVAIVHRLDTDEGFLVPLVNLSVSY
jgi:hypothetical protein